MPEWSKGVDSSSTVARLVGSNPTPYNIYIFIYILYTIYELKNLVKLFIFTYYIMVDLKKQLLMQEKLRMLFQKGLANKRKQEREQFYKEKYCEEIHNEVLGKVIYYDKGDDKNEEAGLILGISKEVENMTFSFWDIGVNDLPFTEECDLRAPGAGENAIIVSFKAYKGLRCDYHIGRHYHNDRYDAKLWADNIKRAVKK